MYRRRKWQPTPVLLPGNSHGWRSLVGCSPWGCKELDMTERLHYFYIYIILHYSLIHSLILPGILIISLITCPTFQRYKSESLQVHRLFHIRDIRVWECSLASKYYSQKKRLCELSKSFNKFLFLLNQLELIPSCATKTLTDVLPLFPNLAHFLHWKSPPPSSMHGPI